VAVCVEDSDLLAEREDLKGHIASTAEKDANHREEGKEKFRHEITLVTCCNVVPRSLITAERKSLIAKHHGFCLDSGPARTTSPRRCIQ
jgi:hypothetical protein